MNSDVTRYCELVTEISELNKYLNSEYDDFYYGGHSFEDVYRMDLENLSKLENELILLIRKFTTQPKFK